MELTPSDARALYLALADYESGTPRQWLYLELAAEQTEGPASRRARLGLWLLQRMGAGLAVPYFGWLGLPGLAPYRWPQDIVFANYARHGAFIAAIVLCGLIGFARLNATRELALVLIALFGAVGCGGWLRWQLQDAAGAMRLAAAQRADQLTPAESTLGLAGLLVASGEIAQLAQRVTALRQTPELALTPDCCQQLALAAPLDFYLNRASCMVALAWLLGVLAVAWPCWLTSRVWQVLPALLGVLLVGFVVQQKRAAWLRQSALHVAIAVAVGLACWLWSGMPKL